VDEKGGQTMSALTAISWPLLLSMLLWVIFLSFAFTTNKHKVVMMGMAGTLGLIFGIQVILLPSDLLGGVILIFSFYVWYLALWGGKNK
jgi:hypothetical protein